MRELQPNAVISISGPDVRWCGNEAGEVRESEWSVVAKDMTDPSITAELSQHEDNEEFRDRPLDETQSDLGSRERLKNEKELVWYPAETDVSIRPGWFYHEEEDDKVRSFENLKDIYLKSVGGNTALLLNIPPMKNGKIHEKDMAILKRLGEFINDTFKNNLLKNALITTVPEHDCRGNSPDMMRTDDYNTYFMNKEGDNKLLIEIKFDECKKLKYLVLKEAITFSQRVEKFNVYFNDESGNKIKIFEGTTIGYKRIIDLKGTKTDNLTIEIEDSRVAPVMSFVGVY